MYRSSTCAFAFGILAAVSCGPNDLEEDRFPALSDSGYPDGRGSAGAAGVPVATAGAGGAAAGAGGAPQGSSGAPSVPPEMVCPEDITLLFNRPIADGGCNGPGCHSPGNTTPDLVSPDPAQRLLNVASSCNGRPYIGAMDSFLADKIANNPPECGSPMPFLMAGNLSAEDEACILQWIDEVSSQ